ncbi:DUF3545 domain-containing protein [Psychromonas sp. psych-6C06]|uniref:DUF3545 family protein n=1 Tax=Psychromonas sp. psych-6C06 TaxID=2058089 RepID=UPI000C34650D|nr:DUF3545 family protein [Psychromonas sp. psych-6C06]PKF62002.1 DUF3545 domain-containing protein [Psychromonas sp. psych-6C06]
MQTLNFETQMSDEDALFFTPKKKTSRTRKWREIEEIKERQRLSRELREIDQTFDFSLSELV